MIKRLTVLLLLFVCAAPILRAEEEEDPDAFAKEHLDGVSGERALELVKELSAPAMKGRRTGTAGGEAVENWMLNKMAEFGLHPEDAGGTYLEPFALMVDGKRAKGHNALGGIKGRDADLVHEIILVTAAMDGPGLSADGKVLPGADDNASGAAVLIHLADVLTTNRLRPKRTVIFCGFGASQAGHIGSRELAARYPFRGDVVAVLDINKIGQGEPVALVRGARSFPKVGAILEAAIPAGMKKSVEASRKAGPVGDDSAFEERGVAAFSVSTRGEHPNLGTPKDAASAIKPACLNAGAQAAGRLLLALAMHPESLHDATRIHHFLAREGPTFCWASLWATQGPVIAQMALGGAAGAHDPIGAGNYLTWADAGVAGEPKACAAQLATLEKAERGEYGIIRRAADVARLAAAGKIGLLPAIHWPAGTTPRDPKQIAALAALGYRVMAPWNDERPADTPPSIAEITAVVAAAKAAEVLLLVEAPLGEAGWAALWKALGDYPVLVTPATAAKAPKDTAALAYDFRTGLNKAGHRRVAEALGSTPTVLIDANRAVLARQLAAHLAKAPEGWSLPGSAQRLAIRAAFGGNLVTWLARAEKKTEKK